MELPNGILIDKSDSEICLKIKWSVKQDNNVKYAYASINHKTVYLHRFLMKPPKGFVVDHINGNGLDNRRTNLRIVTHQENLQCAPRRSKKASSGYRGVYLSKEKTKWVARLKVDGKFRSFGSFPCKRAAAKAFDKACLKHRGKFAVLNFPKKPMEPK